MPDLSRDLRRTLETTIRSAREVTELGAADALRRLGVFESRRPTYLDDARNENRKRLRAHAKSLGDRLDGEDGTSLRRLIEAAAYVQWHRILFARFLIERDLLRDDLGVVSLADCREDAGAGGDEWAIAASHAARMLPGVFPSDDPVEGLTLAPEHAKALRDHLLKLEPAIFQADDSLGWTYQFWRAAEKKAINESGRKIGAAELPAVTQLFTEPYMVRFLLHNTLGAWWAGKVLSARPDLARDASNEDVLRDACALPGYAWDFLRFVKEDEVWRPAAGVFPGWPANVAALTVLDPCCGSGHFLTEALEALAALRGIEETMSPAEAVVAVLRDNLAGLEIDGRCVQIATFSLAVMAWRIGGAGMILPTPHVAWVGGPPPLLKAEFAALANGDAELRRGLEALHELFMRAPLFGSLIEPVGGDLIDPTRVARIEDSIGALTDKIRGAEPERIEGVLAARGMADAAGILSRRWVLQITNVPFLSSSKMEVDLSKFIEQRYEIAKSDLSTVFLMSMISRSEKSGTIALVTPHNWYLLGSYRKLRERLLDSRTIQLVCDLGPAAFHDMNWWAARTALTIISSFPPYEESKIAAFDASEGKGPPIKAATLSGLQTVLINQTAMKANPDSRIAVALIKQAPLLSRLAASFQGVKSGDDDHFRGKFWEIAQVKRPWRYFQSTVEETTPFGGRQSIVRWADDGSQMARRQGLGAFDRQGVAISQMRHLPASLFFGDVFDSNISPIIPHDPANQAALWAYCSDPEFHDDIRRIDRKVAVANATFVKVPFDLVRWQGIAAEKYPNGLPEPYSDDPTQWLFHGHPLYATRGTELQVALARLSGYRWPAETDPAMRLSTSARRFIGEAAGLPSPDADGLLALVPVLGDRPLTDRLRAFCVAVWGEYWTPNSEAALVAAACDRAKDKPPRQLTLDDWLRSHAARQHAKLFHERPFLWWITDGRTDGFTAVAHYHRLSRNNLERLAYTVLGDWIARLGNDPRAEAARILQSKLALILEGEAPHDIFVRWKPLEAQPMGWDPDLDDGVRLNIRPFIEAGVLSYAPNVHYRMDRGKDVSSAPWFHRFNGERRNDYHATLEEKRAARTEHATKVKARV